MGRRIVVAVDQSEESLHALEWCLHNVVAPAPPPSDDEEGRGNLQDTLVLLYARAPPPLYPSIDGTGYMFSSDVMATVDRYGREVAVHVMEKAKKICASFPAVKVETMVVNGDARDVKCEEVDKAGADLLVLGSHGYGLIKRTFLGSVSNHCAQNAKCPVLIVKRSKH